MNKTTLSKALTSALLLGAASISQAAMQSPAPGSALTSNEVTFTWDDTGASVYAIHIGSDPVTMDFGTYNQLTETSLTRSNLPVDGRKLFVRLFERVNGVDTHRDYIYTAASADNDNPAAEITSPAPSSTLNSTEVTFEWDAGFPQYEIYVGSKHNGYEHHYSQPSANSVTVAGLPDDGSLVFVRLKTQRADNTWSNAQYFTFGSTVSNPASQPAGITSPVAGSTFDDTSVMFGWEDVQAAEYHLMVGSALDANDIYDNSQGTQTSATIDSLPNSSETVYVRLSSRFGTEWLHKYANYTADAAPFSGMVFPVNGSTLNSTSVTFGWTGQGVSEYTLDVGTMPGSGNIYSMSQGTSQSVDVDGLPDDGSTVYVRLSYEIGGTWEYTDYSYTAQTAAALGEAATMISPSAGAFIGGSTAFDWQDVGANEYALHVSGYNSHPETPDASAVYTSTTSQTTAVSHGGVDFNALYVRLYSKYGSEWVYNDYSYISVACPIDMTCN
ncbi:hypothetical protein ACFL2V_05080 [Pseudomonadota bacterium]